MNNSIKYIFLTCFGIGMFYLVASKRNLKIGIVNTQEEIRKVQIKIDAKSTQVLRLQQSIIPLDFINLKIKTGFHEVQIFSEECEMVQEFKFFNLIGYNIGLEFQEGCTVIKRRSHFPVVYQ